MSDSFIKRHSIPSLIQRQDSTWDQLKDLIQVAEQLGMYDAADVIKKTQKRYERL